ncbi:uncharacterized protein LOC130694739 [Daphnia carinata]|uniref:uncharacterized protein LOC130694739 n=1 Tax=Daphnia carinata TaxID=120202 RepID=UPI00257C62D6|nr:uncharacterized protein LOC130694739 [Daphnia carinata]
MNSSKDISAQILKCVEEATQEILNCHGVTGGDNAMSSTTELFLKLFPTNLALAINSVYFKEDDNTCSTEMDQTKEAMEHEKTVMEIIGKRRQGTTACRDVLEKTLAIEQKRMMALEVASGVVNVQKYEMQSVPYKKEELKIGAKKTLENLKSAAKQAVDLNCRAEELTEAAIMLREADTTDFESINSF